MPANRLQPGLGRGAIAELLPHAGEMVLLDAIDSWDENSIRCRTWSHLRIDNPLRRGNAIGAAAAIEYGAQAMALHGALFAGDVAPAGRVASARRIVLRTDRLDGVFSALSVAAHRRTLDGNGACYTFELASAMGVLAAGQITVVFLRTP